VLRRLVAISSSFARFRSITDTRSIYVVRFREYWRRYWISLTLVLFAERARSICGLSRIASCVFVLARAYVLPNIVALRFFLAGFDRFAGSDAV
jgi:hypothetical protein